MGDLLCYFQSNNSFSAEFVGVIPHWMLGWMISKIMVNKNSGSIKKGTSHSAAGDILSFFSKKVQEASWWKLFWQTCLTWLTVAPSVLKNIPRLQIYCTIEISNVRKSQKGNQRQTTTGARWIFGSLPASWPRRFGPTDSLYNRSMLEIRTYSSLMRIRVI